MSDDRIDETDVYGDPFSVERGAYIEPRWRALGIVAAFTVDDLAALDRDDALRVGKFLCLAAGLDVDKLIESQVKP